MEALFIPVEQRLLRRVLDLSEAYHDESNDPGIPITQEDLASMAGTTRATANRVLRQFEDAGALALNRGRVRIVDRAAVARRAGLGLGAAQGRAVDAGPRQGSVA